MYKWHKPLLAHVDLVHLTTSVLNNPYFDFLYTYIG